jgi:hypothetical protein
MESFFLNCWINLVNSEIITRLLSILFIILLIINFIYKYIDYKKNNKTQKKSFSKLFVSIIKYFIFDLFFIIFFIKNVIFSIKFIPYNETDTKYNILITEMIMGKSIISFHRTGGYVFLKDLYHLFGFNNSIMSFLIYNKIISSLIFVSIFYVLKLIFQKLYFDKDIVFFNNASILKKKFSKNLLISISIILIFSLNYNLYAYFGFKIVYLSALILYLIGLYFMLEYIYGECKNNISFVLSLISFFLSFITRYEILVLIIITSLLIFTFLKHKFSLKNSKAFFELFKNNVNFKFNFFIYLIYISILSIILLFISKSQEVFSKKYSIAEINYIKSNIINFFSYLFHSLSFQNINLSDFGFSFYLGFFIILSISLFFIIKSKNLDYFIISIISIIFFGLIFQSTTRPDAILASLYCIPFFILLSSSLLLSFFYILNNCIHYFSKLLIGFYNSLLTKYQKRNILKSFKVKINILNNEKVKSRLLILLMIIFYLLIFHYSLSLINNSSILNHQKSLSDNCLLDYNYLKSLKNQTKIDYTIFSYYPNLYFDSVLSDINISSKSFANLFFDFNIGRNDFEKSKLYLFRDDFRYNDDSFDFSDLELKYKDSNLIFSQNNLTDVSILSKYYFKNIFMDYDEFIFRTNSNITVDELNDLTNEFLINYDLISLDLKCFDLYEIKPKLK